jgi:hypothetical protein
MKAFKLNAMPCPFCGELQNGATEIDGDGKKPEAGDVGICWKCANVVIYTGNGSERRKPTDTELDHIATDKRLRNIVASTRLAMTRKP